METTIHRILSGLSAQDRLSQPDKDSGHKKFEVRNYEIEFLPGRERKRARSEEADNCYVWKEHHSESEIFLSLCSGFSTFCVALGIHGDPQIPLSHKKGLTRPILTTATFNLYSCSEKVYFSMLFQAYADSLINFL